MKLNPKQSKNFWSKVNGNGPSMPEMKTKCWEWTGAKNKGYGYFGVNRKMIYAHRISWMLKNGEIPHNESHHGICVCHKCDNPACVNPDHLFLGTNNDNINNKVFKGRQLYGEFVKTSKLTIEQVVEIRRLGKLGCSHTKIAALPFINIKRETVRDIISHKIWKHVPEKVV